MQAAQREDGGTHHHDKENRHSPGGYGRSLPQGPDESGSPVPKTLPDRAACLHLEPKLVLKAGARTGGLERVVELALQRQQVELLVLAHACSLWTESRSAFSPR